MKTPSRAREGKLTLPLRVTRRISPLLLLLLSGARAQASPPQVVVEVANDAQDVVDVRFTKRMLQIELGDLKPRRVSDPQMPPENQLLYFRVSLREPNTLEVELWNRGELLGKRSISASKGNPQLHSRRIVLAAMELARRAPRQLQLRAEKQAAAHARCERAAARAKSWEQSPRLRLDTSAVAYTLGVDSAWLAGVELRPTVQWSGHTTLGMGLATLQGRTGQGDDKPHLRWFEANVAVGHEWPLSDSWRLTLSLPIGFGAIVVKRPPAVSNVLEQNTFWSARAAVAPGLSRRLSADAWLQFAPTVGWTLREVDFSATSESAATLGGVWLGAALTLSAGPRHR